MGTRLLGWALIVYGLAGLALVGGGAIIGLETAGRLERLASAADGTLAAAVRSTDAAATAFANVDGSLAEAQASAGTAAELARDASGTLGSLARAMELSVFGAQPLLPLAGEFEASSAQAGALADTLDQVGSSMSDTRTDVAEIGRELDALATELEVLRDSGSGGGQAPPLRPFLLLLMAWLLVPALGGVLGGLALLGRARPPVVVP